MERKSRVIGGRTVTVYSCGEKGVPAVYASMYQEAGDQVIRACADAGCQSFDLVSVSGLDWGRDLSPWPYEPVDSDKRFEGGATEYLHYLEDEVLPYAEGIIGTSDRRVIAGYSMAGMFSLYLPHVSTMFRACASVSGSLWYPGFDHYLRDTPFARRPDAVYLSLGDRESRTRNPIMRRVEDATREALAVLQSQGVEAVFELNPGNHFRDHNARVAKALCWLLPKVGGQCARGGRE